MRTPYYILKQKRYEEAIYFRRYGHWQPLTFCLAACSSDDEKVNAASELLNAEKKVAFAATETRHQINVQADCPWEVTAIDKTGWQDLLPAHRR